MIDNIAVIQFVHKNPMDKLYRTIYEILAATDVHLIDIQFNIFDRSVDIEKDIFTGEYKNASSVFILAKMVSCPTDKRGHKFGIWEPIKNLNSKYRPLVVHTLSGDNWLKSDPATAIWPKGPKSFFNTSELDEVDFMITILDLYADRWNTIISGLVKDKVYQRVFSAKRIPEEKRSKEMFKAILEEYITNYIIGKYSYTEFFDVITSPVRIDEDTEKFILSQSQPFIGCLGYPINKYDYLKLESILNIQFVSSGETMDKSLEWIIAHKTNLQDVVVMKCSYGYFIELRNPESLSMSFFNPVRNCALDTKIDFGQYALNQVYVSNPNNSNVTVYHCYIKYALFLNDHYIKEFTVIHNTQNDRDCLYCFPADKIWKLCYAKNVKVKRLPITYSISDNIEIRWELSNGSIFDQEYTGNFIYSHLRDFLDQDISISGNTAETLKITISPRK